ncbi:hypothetical protein JHK87_002576 [Glycine soja]|nr:hypothetical protein JHK87_002576 [Glycine soja]
MSTTATTTSEVSSNEWKVIHMSEQEEDLIRRMYKLVGDKWNLIAGRIPGRKAEEIERFWIMRHGDAFSVKRNGSKTQDSNWEQNALISELIQGLEVARKLKEDLSSASSVDARDSHSLLQRILSSYDKALLFLRWNESVSMQQPTKTSSPQSPLSIDKTPLREDAEEDHQELKHNSKKRQVLPRDF